MKRMAVSLTMSGMLILVAATAARAFEGVVRWRNITVPRQSLSALLPQGSGAKQDAVFAIPAERLLSLKESGNCSVDETTLYIKGSRIRVEEATSDDPEGYLISDVASGRSWMVMPGAKKYMEWTRADSEAVQQKARQIRDMMAEQLKGLDLPPEQRRQLEAAMAVDQPKPQTFKVTRLGKKQAIAGMATEAYEVKGESETALGWVTRERQELSKTMQAWTDAWKATMPQEEQKKDAGDLLIKYGLPLKIQTISKDEYELEELVSLKEQPVDAKLFRLPEGYKRQSMAQLMHQITIPGQTGKPAPEK